MNPLRRRIVLPAWIVAATGALLLASVGVAISSLVSPGDQLNHVPNVIGLRLAVAEERLMAAGFYPTRYVLRHGVQRRPIARGVVVFQDPSAGSAATPGAPVQFAYYAPLRRVLVPRLTAFSEAGVRSEVRTVGLLLGLTTVSRCMAHGQGTGILSQTPAPGSSVEVGSTIYASWSTVFCH